MRFLRHVTRLLRPCLTTALAAAAFTASAWAADFPGKPITFVVPAPPGGPTDILARLLADDMREAWGQPVLIDNKPGAGGLLATHFVARAPADGHTILLAFTNHLTNAVLNPQAGYDPIKDFTPISLLVNAGAVLAFRPSLPIQNWDDFLRHAKASPGGVNIGNAGAGSSTHIYSEMIGEATRLKINPIPYKGEAPMHTELLAGTLDFGLMSIGPYVRFAQAGKLRGIATTLRSPLVPDMPTFADLGVPGPGKVRGWFGVIGPAGIPPEIADKIARRIQQRIAQPEIAARLTNDWAFVPVGSTPDEFAQTMKAEYAEWARVIKSFGIKLE